MYFQDPIKETSHGNVFQLAPIPLYIKYFEDHDLRKDHEENLEYEHIWSNKRSFKVDEEYRNMRVSELEKEFEMLTKEKDPPLKKLI